MDTLPNDEKEQNTIFRASFHYLLKIVQGDVFNIIFSSISSSKVGFLDILKLKWPTIDLTSTASLNDTHHADLEPVET